jgi:hypothetical protein
MIPDQRHERKRDTKARNSAGESFEEYDETPATAQEMHVCMGLNACRGLDVDRNILRGTTDEKANIAGMGNCATVRHVCHGEGDCRGQGGCGYAGGEYEQFLPGAQACRFNGSCASPVNTSRVFSAGPMKGKSVWKQARRMFEARMYQASLAFGPTPGEGIPDDLLPGYDLRDVRADDIPDPLVLDDEVERR